MLSFASFIVRMGKICRSHGSRRKSSINSAASKQKKAKEFI